MAAGDMLTKIGLHLDDINALRVLDPEIAGPTNQLNEELQQFTTKVDDFRKIVTHFKEEADKVATEVEKEKMKAIASRNLLKSVTKQRESQQQQLHALIMERRVELERLKIRYGSLTKDQQESVDFMDQFVLQK